MRRLALLCLGCAGCHADPRTDQVDRIFAHWDQPGSPGCAVGIIENGKFLYERGYGLANLEHNIKIGGNTAFYLGSTSKQFTAMAAFLLAQRRVISLDDPVRRYLRELPAYAANVRIRNLLEHTSGIRDYVTLLNLAGVPDDASLGEREALELIARQKELNFQPGEEFLYSNSGYFLLGLILKRAAFRRLSELAQEAIFTPLGMHGTLYLEDRFGLVKNRATGYSPRSSAGGYRIDSATYEVIGDGGVFTTLDDLLLWDRNFYEPKLGGAAGIREMTTPATLNNGRKLHYARGLMLRDYRGHEMLSHAGGFHGYRSEILRFPALHLSILCLCNVSTAEASRLARQVADIYVPDRGKPLDATINQRADSKQGMLRDRATGELLRLFPQESRLMAEFGGLTFELAPASPTLFRSRNAPIDFEMEFDERDQPTFLRIESETEKPANFERVELRAKPSANLEEYAGEYYSEETGSTFCVAFNEGRLELRQKDSTIGVLEPTMKDRFRMSFLNLEFTRRAPDSVGGFLLNTGRVRKLRFDRR